jgi:EmrB/QacA subfamily drug resistance transporter
LEQYPSSLELPRKPVTNKNLVLLTTSVALFFSAFTFTGVNVALPAISREFEADAIALSWVVTSFILTVGVFQLPWGRIADMIGIKKIFILGMTVFILATLTTALSNSMTMLIISQVARGIGGSMIYANSTALLTAVFPAKDRGRALGINTAVLYGGQSAGPFIGGILTEHLGWRSIFLFNIPAYLVLIALLVWKVKGEWSQSRGQKFDTTGSLIYGLALVTVMYGFSLLPDVPGIILTAAGTLGLIGFIRWETRVKSPIVNIGIFRNNHTLVFSNIAALINYSAIFAVSFLLSLYLQYIKGLNPEQAGLVLLAQPIVQAFVSPISGRLSDRIEPRIVASCGMVLTFFGLLSFVFLTADSALLYVVIGLVALGAGTAFFGTPNTNAIMSSVAPGFYGVAAAVTGTMRSVGQMISMATTVVVMALVIGRVVVTPEYYSGFLTASRVSFGVFTLLSVGGIFASLARGKVRDR